MYIPSPHRHEARGLKSGPAGPEEPEGIEDTQRWKQPPGEKYQASVFFGASGLKDARDLIFRSSVLRTSPGDPKQRLEQVAVLIRALQIIGLGEEESRCWGWPPGAARPSGDLDIPCSLAGAVLGMQIHLHVVVPQSLHIGQQHRKPAGGAASPVVVHNDGDLHQVRGRCWSPVG